LWAHFNKNRGKAKHNASMAKVNIKCWVNNQTKKDNATDTVKTTGQITDTSKNKNNDLKSVCIF